MDGLAEAGAALLGDRAVSALPMAGGDLSAVMLVRLGSGREVVVKSGADPAAEGAMLAAIRDAGVPAPEPLGASAMALALERMPCDGRLSSEGWRDLGAAVRRLHDVHGHGYGWPRDYAFSRLAIPNGPCASWPEFWAERRLLAEAHALPLELTTRLQALAAALPDLLPAAPPPSLLHGDLWEGNVMAHEGRLSALIDPASYYGHAEADLAMLSLFGQPDPAFFDGYGPLEPGAEARRPIYQLWPAIVHARLFGAGYHGMVERLLRAAGA